jgi:hypothetical protein
MKITRRGLLLRAADAVAAALLASTIRWLPAPAKSGIEEVDEASKFHVGQTVHWRASDGHMFLGDVPPGTRMADPYDIACLGRITRIGGGTIEISAEPNPMLADIVFKVKQQTGRDVTKLYLRDPRDPGDYDSDSFINWNAG